LDRQFPKETYEEMFNIFSHKGHANANDTKNPYHLSGCLLPRKQATNAEESAEGWEEGPHALLMGI
jgi:hypothetical protein